MGFTLSSLTDYAIENENQILSASILGARTLGLVNIQPNIKTTEELNIFAVDVELQADTGCSYNSSGATTFTNRALTVSDMAVMQNWCPKDLEAKYTQKRLKPGDNKDLPFEQEIVDLLIKGVQKRVEVATWQGNTDYTFSTNLKHYHGFIKQIDAAGTAIDGNTSSAASITVANAVTIFNNIYQQVPSEVLGADDLVAFCGMDTFILLKLNLINNNLFHYNGNSEANAMSLTLPNGLKVEAVNGLNAGNDANLPVAAKNRIFAGRKSNFFFGTDLANEQEVVDIWYSKDDRVVKSLMTFKAGTQVAFPTEIVQYKND